MNLLDFAPNVGITCLVLQTIIAVVYFFKHRFERQRANQYRARFDAVSVDNVGLRAQNARLIQTVAKLKGGIQRAGEMCQQFDLEKK